jgi:AcrR family transcriptional regulator
MLKRSDRTRLRILENAYRMFYREGYQRAGVDAVAAAAGITKRTLYNHFPSKDALIAAVLEAQAELAAAEIRSWCGDTSQSPEQLIGQIFGGLRRWSGEQGWRGSGFTRAAMELAWAPGHPARRLAAVQKLAVEQMLGDALAKVGADHSAGLARELVVLLEGAMALRLIHGDDAWLHAAERAALKLTRHH